MSTFIHSHTTIGINNLRTLDEAVEHRGVRIPAGFSWNGASVPRPFWFIMPKWGENSMAFLMHDFLYSTEGPGYMTRLDADTIMYDDLKELGCSKPRAWLVYKTVRLFGGSYFRK
jgi:hypothetical protein